MLIYLNFVLTGSIELHHLCDHLCNQIHLCDHLCNQIFVSLLSVRRQAPVIYFKNAMAPKYQSQRI